MLQTLLDIKFFLLTPSFHSDIVGLFLSKLSRIVVAMCRQSVPGTGARSYTEFRIFQKRKGLTIHFPDTRDVNRLLLEIKFFSGMPLEKEIKDVGPKVFYNMRK